MLDLQAPVSNSASRALEDDAGLLASAPILAVREAADTLKDEARAEVSRGLNFKRGPKFIRSFVFDDGGGDAAAIVASTWIRKDGSDPLLPHATGATIRPKNGKFLLIPAPGPRRRSTAQRALASLEADPKLDLVPQGRGNFVIIRRVSSRRTKLLGFLRRKVKVPKSIDLVPLVSRASADFAKVLDEKLAPLEQRR